MKEKLRKSRGITLVALVITIIIIIILATITMNFVFGDNGLIIRAQQAVEMTEIARIQEELEMAKGTAAIDGAGEIDPDHYFDIIEDEGIIGDKDTDVEDNGDGSYDVTTDGDYVFEVTPKPDGDLEIEYVGKNNEPRISSIKVTDKTETTVSVEVFTKNVDGGEYTYSYKKTEEGEEVWQDAGTSSSNTFTFRGLENNTSYDIKVTIALEDGTTIEKTITVQLGTGAVDIPDNTIVFGQAVWQGDGTANMPISTSETEYTLQYQVNSTSGQWTTITSGQSITGLRAGDTVYARLTDETETNTSEIQQTTIQDATAPTVNVSLGTSTSNSISVNVEAIDNESGMSSNPTYTYYIKESTEPESSYQTPSGASNITSNTYTFTGLTQGISYDIKVEVRADIAGNMGEGTLLNQITTSIPGGESALEDGTLTIGEPTWSDGEASITVSTNSQYQIEYQVNGIDEGSWTTVTGGAITGLEHGDKVNIRLTDGENAGGYVTKEILDEVPPTVTVILEEAATSNSISVSVEASDNESGMSSNPTYTYYIKQSSQGDEYYQAPAGASNISSSTYTFTGLTQGTSYDVKVEVTGDVAGNTGEGTLTGQTTESIPGGSGEGGDVEEGAITFGIPSWSDGQASITISTSTTYQIEYKLDNPEIDEGWIEIENNGTISGLSHGDTVYARLTDGNNHGDYAVASIQDGINPIVTVTLVQDSITSNGMSVSVEAIDNESGMASDLTYTYYIKQSSQGDENYQAPAGASNISSDTYTFTGLTQGTSYDVKVEVTGDMAL